MVWAAPPRPKELQKRFALTQKLKRIAKAKAEAAKPATTMPASLNGRRLSEAMPGVPIGAMPRGASVRVCTPLRMCPLDGESLRREACSGRVPGDEGGHGGGPGGVHPGPAVRGREQWLG